MLAAARDDAVTFARSGAAPRLIDEVQRRGDDLVPAIKVAVDEDPRPGQFVLSGSSRFFTIPTLSESLAGHSTWMSPCGEAPWSPGALEPTAKPPAICSML